MQFLFHFYRMEDAESSSFLRNRKLGSSSNASSEPIEKGTPKEVGQGPSADDYVDEDSWVSKLISCVRVVACFITMMATTLIWSFILLLLLPWPYERIRQGNVCGRVTSRLMVSYLLSSNSCGISLFAKIFKSAGMLVKLRG